MVDITTIIHATSPSVPIDFEFRIAPESPDSTSRRCMAILHSCIVRSQISSQGDTSIANTYKLKTYYSKRDTNNID